MFACDICGKTFTAKCSMLRHKREHDTQTSFVCNQCGKSFKRQSNLGSHKTFSCRSTDQPGTSTEPPTTSTVFTEIETGLKNRVKTFTVQPPKGDLPSALNLMKEEIAKKIEEVLQTYPSLKFNLFTEAEFMNPIQEKCCRSFKTKNMVVYRTSNIAAQLNSALEKLNTEKTSCELKGSGWRYVRLTRLELRVNKYNPLRGSRFIQLPKKIQNTKAVINVQNMDDYCFKYAMLSRYVTNHPYRVSNYINNPILEGKFNWDCVEYPVRVGDIKKFEAVNKVTVSVFGLDEQSSVYPLRVCDQELSNHFDLLYVTSESKSHYCLITNFEKLVHHQLTKKHLKLKICKRCFSHFQDLNDTTAEERLEDHKRLCSEKKSVRCEFPPYDNISFKNSHRSKKVRFVVYADFETTLTPVSGCTGEPSTAWSDVYQRHVPYSYSYLVKDSEEDEHTVLRLYRGPDAVKHFMKSLVKDTQNIDDVLFGDKKLDVPTLTAQQQQEFDSAEICHICKKGDFTAINGKVRNHCHVSGNYLGAAHRHCNLFYQDQHFVPCFIHNLSGYDSHFIVRELGYDTANIKVIPNTEEKYISFSKSVRVKHARNKFIDLRFLDSFRFMSSSLSTLAGNLPTAEFHQTRNYFPTNFDLVTRKGVFPYDFVTDVDKLNVTDLPPKSAFYNKLNDEDIDDQMYDHAKDVWQKFNVRNLGEYSDIYLKSDVLILCDAFEKFRNTCLDTYDLDPAYYYTVPGLAWDAMLKFTGVELEVMKDMDMVMMMEKGIRGGITQCVKRHSVANNKHVPELYLKEMPSKYLFYIDANALYAHAMSRPLPIGSFEWCDVDSLPDITTVPEDGEEGYILEVDLEYPKDLHDSHKDFPFCVETKVPPGKRDFKLLATVEDKTRYVIHYVALQQALHHGLRLKKIHRSLKFHQQPWLKPFIDLNTAKRTAATNAFDKDFYKLLSNSIYGKTMEGVRSRLDIRLVSEPKKLERLICKPNFIDRTIYNENLVGVHMKRTKVVFNKPIYIGMSVLDLSKSHMYQFFYEVLKPYYGDRVRLCYQDTDSFILEIMTEDLYKDLEDFTHHIDTSDYPPDHPLYSTANKKKLGKFKDETNGDPLLAYVGLRCKMYAFKTRKSTNKKIKGIKRSIIKNKIKFKHYVKCLYSGKRTYSKNNLIQSKMHVVQTVTLNKVTLSADDDKRVVMEDFVHTLPYGHWRLTDNPPAKRQRMEEHL